MSESIVPAHEGYLLVTLSVNPINGKVCKDIDQIIAWHIVDMSEEYLNKEVRSRYTKRPVTLGPDEVWHSGYPDYLQEQFIWDKTNDLTRHMDGTPSDLTVREHGDFLTEILLRREQETGYVKTFKEESAKTRAEREGPTQHENN